MPPDIILPSPFVLIQQTNSQLGIYSVDNKYSFGEVALVYDTSDRVSVGDAVMFKSNDIAKFIYGSTVYYLVREENITGTEVLPP